MVSPPFEKRAQVNRLMVNQPARRLERIGAQRLGANY
jgi:hypothetical protein